MRSRLTLVQAGARTVLVVAPVVVLLADRWGGAGQHLLLVAVVVAAGATAALRPRSHAATVALLAAFGSWWTGPVVLGPQLLVAALAVVATHVAGVIAGYGPGRLEVDPVLLHAWRRRAGLLLATSVVAWLVARAAHPAPGLAAVGLLVLAAIGLWAASRFGDERRVR